MGGGASSIRAEIGSTREHTEDEREEEEGEESDHSYDIIPGTFIDVFRRPSKDNQSSTSSEGGRKTPLIVGTPMMIDERNGEGEGETEEEGFYEQIPSPLATPTYQSSQGKPFTFTHYFTQITTIY